MVMQRHIAPGIYTVSNLWNCHPPPSDKNGFWFGDKGLDFCVSIGFQWS